jgi:hypothetical protein
MSRRERMSYEAESSLNYDYVLRNRGALQVGEVKSGEARQVVGRGARGSPRRRRWQTQVTKEARELRASGR